MANVYQFSNLCFLDPVTPQTLKAAVEITEKTQMGKEHEVKENLFEDDLESDAWVFCHIFYVIQYI